MKKIALLGLMLFVVFTTSGCRNFSYDIEINKNGKVTLSETESIDFSNIEKISYIAQKAQTKIEEKNSEFEAQGYTVKRSDNGSYKEYTRTKTFETFTDNSVLPEGFAALQPQPIMQEKAFLKNKYIIKWSYDAQRILDNTKSKLENIDSITPEDTEEYDDSEDYAKENTQPEIFNFLTKKNLKNLPLPTADLVIKLPFKAKSHNANFVSKTNGKYEYKWNLNSKDEIINIELIYDKTDYTNSFAVLALLVLCGAMFLYMQKLKDGSF